MIKEQCISCGRDDVPLFPTDGAFMPEGYKTCASCQLKYSSAAGEADRLMTEYTPPEQYYCYSCGEPVVMDAHGQVNMYCHPCLHSIFKSYKAHRV